LMSDPDLLTAEASRLTRLPAGHQEGWADGLRNLLDDFYAAVSAHSRKEPYEASFATFADGHRISELVDAIVASNRSRGWTLVGQVEQVEA